MIYGNGVMKDMVMMGPFMWLLMLLVWSLVLVGLISAGRWLIAHTGYASQKRNSSVNNHRSRDVR